MSLMPYDPFKQLVTMRKDFENFFSDFDFASTLGFDKHFSGIRVDVHETENEIVATCDIPGLEKKEDVQIDIQNNVLSISGTVNHSQQSKQENIHRQERFIGRFHRSITLPSPVSHEGVKASYRNGVLEVRMPKKMRDDKKKIDIEFYH